MDPADVQVGDVLTYLPAGSAPGAFPDLLSQRWQLGWIRPLLGTALFGYAALLYFQHLRQARSSRSSQGPTA